jgi:hypothetical protein
LIVDTIDLEVEKIGVLKHRVYGNKAFRAPARRTVCRRHPARITGYVTSVAMSLAEHRLPARQASQC